MSEAVEVIRVVVEIVTVVLLPVLIWLLRSTVKHSQRLTILEEKVNADITHRIDNMDQKFDKFDTKIETKLDRLERNLHAKIEIMTAVITNCANTILGQQVKHSDQKDQ